MKAMPQSKSDIGPVYNHLEGYFSAQKRELSFLNDGWTNLCEWSEIARAKALDLLSYFPPSAPLDPGITDTVDCGRYIREEVEFNTSALTRISGTVLIPKEGRAPYPAVVGLHDHGGFYYCGREKIIDAPDIPGPVRAFKDNYYGGRSWATELAMRGYVVLVIDAFYFGRRRTDFNAIDGEIVTRLGNKLEGLEVGSDAYIEAFNLMSSAYEALMIKHIVTAGATWAGILAYDDRASVDYLLSRADVDPKRIGCCGLSIGGFRAALLAATDPRVSCSIVTGWMPTTESLLYDHLRNHTYMVNIPGLARHMEFPDLMSLTAPNSLFVQQSRYDALYTEEGMADACALLGQVYGKAGIPEKFKWAFYDVPHEFNVEMQEDAFAWLGRHLQA